MSPGAGGKPGGAQDVAQPAWADVLDRLEERTRLLEALIHGELPVQLATQLPADLPQEPPAGADRVRAAALLSRTQRLEALASSKRLRLQHEATYLGVGP